MDSEKGCATRRFIVDELHFQLHVMDSGMIVNVGGFAGQLMDFQLHVMDSSTGYGGPSFELWSFQLHVMDSRTIQRILET